MQQQPQPDSFIGRPDLWRRVAPTAIGTAAYAALLQLPG